MRSSPITTLFAEPPPFKRGPSSVAFSVTLHCLVMVWLYFGLRHVPQVNDQSFVRRFTVRLLKEDIQEPPRKRLPAGGSAGRPSQTSVAHAAPSGGEPTPMPSAIAKLDELRKHSQTLIQADVPPDVTLLQEVPVPLVVRWTAENALDKAIVLPQPKVLTAADIRASVTRPNREPTLDQVKISATPFKTQAPTLPPSTTTPISVRGIQPAKEVPETASQSQIQPTQAQVISLSDFRMKDGNATIPFANATPNTTASEHPLTPGQSINGPQNGNGKPGTVPNGSGTGQNVASAGDKPGSGNGSGMGLNGADTKGGQGSGSGEGGGSFTHIVLPQDGQFGVVVVGSSLADQYPELVNIWGGRLVYTVYLHVGLGKNWILQYSLLPTAEAAAAGSVTRPDAPWPYDISRPDLAPTDYNSDAIMVHGFINLTGRFEKLAIAFPTEFAQAKFVLSALQRWKFRPARQNGQLTPVEVLLIIPEMVE
jgi:hypothetical protein